MDDGDGAGFSEHGGLISTHKCRSASTRIVLISQTKALFDDLVHALPSQRFLMHWDPCGEAVIKAFSDGTAMNIERPPFDIVFVADDAVDQTGSQICASLRQSYGPSRLSILAILPTAAPETLTFEYLSAGAMEVLHAPFRKSTLHHQVTLIEKLQISTARSRALSNLVSHSIDGTDIVTARAPELQILAQDRQVIGIGSVNKNPAFSFGRLGQKIAARVAVRLAKVPATVIQNVRVHAVGSMALFPEHIENGSGTVVAYLGKPHRDALVHTATIIHLMRDNDDEAGGVLGRDRLSGFLKIANRMDDIVMIRGANQYSEITYESGGHHLLLDTPLKAIRAQFRHQFIQCHRSYLVPVQKVRMARHRNKSRFELVMKQHAIPVGDRFLEELRQRRPEWFHQ